MLLRTIVCVGILALATSARPARGADEPKVETTEDVTYTKAGDVELKLDVVRPSEGDGPFPAVVCIHGGGWSGGKRQDMRPFQLALAKHGYVTISPQYRLAPKHLFPAQVHDVKAAVRWLRSHAKDYKVDPDRIGATGVSAGGHLSLMLGVTGPDDGLEGDDAGDDHAPSSRVQAVVNFVGPTDLAAPDYPDVSRGILKTFFGGDPSDKRATAIKASPVTYLTKDDAPALNFFGTRDPLVPYSQAVRLADAMTAAGAPGRVELIVGAGHFWGGPELERTSAEMFEFFDRHLKPRR